MNYNYLSNKKDENYVWDNEIKQIKSVANE